MTVSDHGSSATARESVPPGSMGTAPVLAMMQVLVQSTKLSSLRI